MSPLVPVTACICVFVLMNALIPEYLRYCGHRSIPPTSHTVRVILASAFIWPMMGILLGTGEDESLAQMGFGISITIFTATASWNLHVIFRRTNTR